MRVGASWRRAVQGMLIGLALTVPGRLPQVATATAPTLLLAPDRGHYQGECRQPSDGIAMALGKDFSEGAGVALYAMRYEGASLRPENIQTLLATIVVRDGRFVAGNLGLRTLLCGLRERYPDGTRIEVVAESTDVAPASPQGRTALARTIFTVDAAVPLPATQRCFSATLLCVRDRFHDYWLASGGLTRHGYPLTGALTQQLEDGRSYTVQYFERSRLEHHPENLPPSDVLLGQFGRRIRPADPPAAPLPGQVYFPDTGHNLGAGFLQYWQGNGGLPQFGYPLSEEFEEVLEDGNVYRVQYFERARFEYHPEHAPPYDILLGQFGRRILAGSGR